MSCVSSFAIKNDGTISLSDEEDQRVRGKDAQEKKSITVHCLAVNCYFFLDFYNVHVIFRLLYIS